MNEQPQTGLPDLNRDTLSALVRQAIHNDSIEIDTWSITRLPYPALNPITRGIYRVSGTALDGNAWSLILKIDHDPQQGPIFEDPVAPFYWKREALANESGLLDTLPGELEAARCYRVEAEPDGSYRLWFQDLADVYGGLWPLERFGLAARQIGSFNGAYLTGTPYPAYPWLCLNQLRTRVAYISNPVEPLVEDAALWDQELMRRTYPQPIRDRLRRLLDERELFLSAVEALPQTLCHYDLYSANLFAVRDSSGRDRTIAIDWAFPGNGAAGEDINILVYVNLLHRKVDLGLAQRYEQIVFDGYIEGLQEAGWQGNAQTVRFVYATAAALQWPFYIVRQHLQQSITGIHRDAGQIGPVATPDFAPLVYHLLDLADEARTLL